MSADVASATAVVAMIFKVTPLLIRNVTEGNSGTGT